MTKDPVDYFQVELKRPPAKYNGRIRFTTDNSNKNFVINHMDQPDFRTRKQIEWRPERPKRRYHNSESHGGTDYASASLPRKKSHSDPGPPPSTSASKGAIPIPKDSLRNSKRYQNRNIYDELNNNNLPRDSSPVNTASKASTGARRKDKQQGSRRNSEGDKDKVNGDKGKEDGHKDKVKEQNKDKESDKRNEDGHHNKDKVNGQTKDKEGGDKRKEDDHKDKDKVNDDAGDESSSSSSSDSEAEVVECPSQSCIVSK